MAKEKIVTAVDIGSSSIRVGCALLRPGFLPKLVGVGVSPSLGVRRGQIVDVVEVVSSLNEALKEAERTAGFKISKVIASVGGPQVDLMTSTGSVAISRADGEISSDDIKRVLASANAISLPQNKEILHTVPTGYTVDGEENIEDPLGMKGVRLEVNTILVLVSKPILRAISKALEQTGRQVEGWVYEPFAVSRAVLSKKQKEAGVLLMNIGGAMTTLSVFREQQLDHAAVLSLGSASITHDVAIGLRAAIDVAEKVKVEYGSCFARDISKREQVVLADWGLEDISISRHSLCQIIESRSSEIFSNTQKEIKKFTKEKNLPAGVILTGGGAKLSGIVELAKKELKLPVRVGRVREIESDLSDAFDPAFSTVVGSVLWAYDDDNFQESAPQMSFKGSGVIKKAGEWLRELLP